jgi:hypothetical protein
MRDHAFPADLARSKAKEPQVIRLLAQYVNVPQESIIRAVTSSDKAGCDLFIPRSVLTDRQLLVPVGAEYVTFDYKYRFAGSAYWWTPPRGRGVPDMTVEKTIGRGPGPFFREEFPVANYFVQAYEDSAYADRIDVLPMRPLTEAVRGNIGEWTARYGTRNSTTFVEGGGSYTSRLVFVPLPVVREAIRTVSNSQQ